MLNSKPEYRPLPTNITLGWKGYPGIKTLAYLEHAVRAVKGFVTLAPEQNCLANWDGCK
jgi:hypothetical protein